MKHLNVRGDTIIEVLLAITIVSVILGGAYISSNSSLNANRASQERVEAVKYTESQIERIKASPATYSLQTGYYCISDAGAVVAGFTASPPSDFNADDFTEYPAGCKKGTIPGNYNLSITQTGGLYTVRVRWERSGGNAKQEVKMVYRVE